MEKLLIYLCENPLNIFGCASKKHFHRCDHLNAKSRNALLNPPVYVYSFLGVLWPRTQRLPSSQWIRSPEKKWGKTMFWKCKCIDIYVHLTNVQGGVSGRVRTPRAWKGNWDEWSRPISKALLASCETTASIFSPVWDPWYLGVCFMSGSPGQLEQHVF